LINLVKNALKFTNSGFILIRALFDETSDYLVVQVQDSGAGISTDEIPRLFSKFGKLQRTAEMNSHGIGLGLLIVKQIVERSGGAITVHSDGPGKGSTFSFSFKMRQAAPTTEDDGSLPLQEMEHVTQDPERNISIELNPPRQDSELHEFADELERELELGRER